MKSVSLKPEWSNFVSFSLFIHSFNGKSLCQMENPTVLQWRSNVPPYVCFSSSPAPSYVRVIKKGERGVKWIHVEIWSIVARHHGRTSLAARSAARSSASAGAVISVPANGCAKA
jgi:hypothetical protein